MKIKNYVLPVMIAFFSISVAQAQTVDEIINKHIEAIGGKDKLNQVKSLYIENSIEVMGNQAPMTEFLVEGKGYKSESDFNGTKIISCYTDKNGWSVNPMMGGTDPQPMSDAMYKSGKIQIYTGGVLVDYDAKGYKAELAGKEDGNIKIKVSNGDNVFLYLIDPKTYLISKTIIKSEMMGQPVDITTTFSEYKKTEFGIVFPFAKNVDMGMFQLAQKVTKLEMNKEIDTKIFEIPK